MLKISTYEIQEKSIDIYLSKIESKIGSPFNDKMMYSCMKIRQILQTLIDRERNRSRVIENIFTGSKQIPYINVMDTVYSKGGAIIDWITCTSDMKVKDLDYSVAIEDRSQFNESVSHAQVSSKIERELRWLFDEQEKIHEDELLDGLFEGYDEIEMYNAYDESKLPVIFKRSTVKLSKPTRFISHYSTNLRDNIELHRYYYSMYIKNDKVRHELKLNIVDLSVEITNKYKYKSNLMKRWIDTKTYIITQSNLALLDDQLVSLLFSAVTLNSKYEKRKKRVYNLLLELENSEICESNIKLNSTKKLNSISQPYDVVYFCRYLCANGVNLKDWIVRVAEDKHIDKKESQEQVCKMMREVLPRVVRRFIFQRPQSEKNK